MVYPNFVDTVIGQTVHIYCLKEFKISEWSSNGVTGFADNVDELLDFEEHEYHVLRFNNVTRQNEGDYFCHSYRKVGKVRSGNSLSVI